MIINNLIKECFTDSCIMSDRRYDSLFKGRNLPNFVKEFILRKHTNSDGTVNEDKISTYLETMMPSDPEVLKQRLLRGESVSITTRFQVDTDMAQGKVRFTLCDLKLNSDAYVSAAVLEDRQHPLTDGEHWGLITLIYVEPEGRRKGYVLMTFYRSFEPYYIELSDYFEARSKFTKDTADWIEDTELWIDFLVTPMGYDPTRYTTEQKREIISRLLAFVEPRLNMIELGPKGTGKTFLYNNLSKYIWILSGRTSRAKLFYNKSTKQFGVMKNFDVVGIDEISTFKLSDPDEMQSILKSYLEAGKAAVDNVMFQSECGLVLIGNIPLDKDLKPINPSYVKDLPEMFRESATMDRFHGFIEGWKIPRLNKNHIIEGWVLNCEYFSTVLHMLRYTSEYDAMFSELVQVPDDCDLRDKNAVQRLTTAYHKLLYPHIRSLANIPPEDVDDFKYCYNKYCLQPAMHRRQIIRTQCSRIDKEFKPEIAKFSVVGLTEETESNEPTSIEQ